jgi:hypothetical protein
MMNDRAAYTIRLPRGLRDQLRLRAYESGETIASFIRALVRRELEWEPPWHPPDTRVASNTASK